MSMQGVPSRVQVLGEEKTDGGGQQYLWDDPYPYKVCRDDMIRHCVPYEEVSFILQHIDCLEARGHHGSTRRTYKVLQCGFPQMFWL